MLVKAKGGSDEAKLEIIRLMAGIKKSLAKSWCFTNPTIDRDDLLCQADLAILSAIEKFKPDGPATFLTYASRAITNHFIKWAAQNAPSNPITREAEARTAQFDTGAASQIFDGLDPIAARVADLRFGSGWTLYKIGKELGISKKICESALDRAIIYIESNRGSIISKLEQ